MAAPSTANPKDLVIWLLSEISAWARRFASVGLAVFILLTIVKLFGFPTYLAIPQIGWQEFGIFVAGTAFALGTRL